MPFFMAGKTLTKSPAKKNRISKLCGFLTLFAIQRELTIATEFATSTSAAIT